MIGIDQSGTLADGPAKPDFEALRAQRDAAIEAFAKKMWIELGGDPDTPPTFHSRGYGAACYCACPDGPCEHEWGGEREITDDEDRACGVEQFCQRCGEGAMSHSLRTGP